MVLTSLIGRQLGRYTIQEEIGRGGMARVYRARDTQLRRTVALKVLAPQLALDTEFIQRFDREAVIAANLQHPNIVTIYDVGEHDGLRAIAMEYIQGRTLHALINERGALGLGVAIAVVAAVASALDYAHSQGAVHRDIKPHNIMLSVDGRVLLTDFGIAQAPEARDGDRLTRTGIFMGTPEYISPEQASAQRVDGRSDLYSLGITAYEIITGKVPFSGATPQLMLAHLQQPPPPLSAVIADQPPELDLVLARALAKSPDKRYPTGAAFVAALREVARNYQISEANPALLATLAQPDSSAGMGTIAVDRSSTERGNSPAFPAGRTSRPVSGPSSRPLPPPDRRPSVPNMAQRPGTVPTTRPVQPPRRWIVAAAVGIVAVLLVGLLVRAAFSGGKPLTPQIPTIQPIATRIPTATPEPSQPVVATAVPTAEATLAPTEMLPSPTLTPSLPPLQRPTRRPVTEVPPTEIPPTEEPPTEVLPTEIPPTEIPPTEIPPTETPLATIGASPSFTPTLAPTLTATPVPPPATAVPTTVVPTAAPTTAIVAPTLTATPVPPTATAVPPTATTAATLMPTP